MILKSLNVAALCWALAVAALMAQTVRLHWERQAHRELQMAVAQDRQQRAEAALKAEQETAEKESEHAAATLANGQAFEMAALARDAAVRRDLAVAERLRLNAERRAATYRQMAQANAAACERVADRHAALDAHIVRGVEVVAGLRGDLDRRDAEVKLLRSQIDADRALLARPQD
ncbi:hypothetical protein CLI92_09045 [Vandammella animalimorsus]|uniref:Uncharacterized protein n=1 Tax=Vandammella animalimorsus TaxID=2029117 RepID=A0A2A2T4N4_9BURK|nr:hypothetical protein [Vandammella animalimorsus]PAT31884.1 hypothetical protein CK626_07760 [Vandammella animalimorsus]PAX16469.1 hypothetical protein CLI92_09045 [Vandammella animalimorsus]PAX18884.1 hypothetical protein CLI93_11125 [Vandammella animalimorsus]